MEHHYSRAEAALRFQPTKRSQIQPKTKPKVLSRPITVKSSSSPDKIQDATSTPAQPVNKTTLADWTAEPEDGDFYAGQRIRGGRKNKKRKKNKQEAERPQWDDIYDPTRPTSFEEYKHSEESAAEMNEWLDQLYAHRKRRTSSVSSEEEYRPAMNSELLRVRVWSNANMIAKNNSRRLPRCPSRLLLAMTMNPRQTIHKHRKIQPMMIHMHAACACQESTSHSPQHHLQLLHLKMRRFYFHQHSILQRLSLHHRPCHLLPRQYFNPQQSSHPHQSATTCQHPPLTFQQTNKN